MSELYVSTNVPSAVMYTVNTSGASISPVFSFHPGGTDGIPLPPESSAFVTALPLDAGARRAFLPYTVELNTDAFGEPRLQSVDGAAVLNWGGSRFELSLRLGRALISGAQQPERLQRIAFAGPGSAGRSVELFRDSGIRMSVYEEGRERSFLLCQGTSANMRILDTGRERLLIVAARDENALEPQQRETLIAMDGRFNIVAQLTAERCAIESGYVTAVTGLGTVLGHERRVRYEFRAGSLLAHPAETGFFSGPKAVPEGERATALAFMQSLLMGIETDAMPFLSEQLRGEVSFKELTEFFETADECRPAPWAAGQVEVGLVRGSGVSAYIFEFENGLISNIIESEPGA